MEQVEPIEIARQLHKQLHDAHRTPLVQNKPREVRKMPIQKNLRKSIDREEENTRRPDKNRNPKASILNKILANPHHKLHGVHWIPLNHRETHEVSLSC